jgi:hypothetical protein
MVYIDACKWLRLKHTLFIEQNLGILWKDSSSSRSKTEQNASMIIFLVLKMDAICSMFGIC